MRKVIFCCLLLLLSLNVWTAPEKFDETLQRYLDLYDVKTKVVLANDILYIEDALSQRSDEMLDQISYILSVIDYMLIDLKIDVEKTTINQIDYMSADNVALKYFDAEATIKYDLIIERDWLVQYFKADKQNRIKMMSGMFKSNFENWTPVQKAKETIDTTQKAK